MSMPRVARLAGIAALLLASSGCELTPQRWGPVTSTYDGKVRVEGSGTFFNDGNTHAANRMRITDRRADGNNVYGRTTFLVWRYSTSHGRDTWVTDQRKSTSEWSGGTHTQTVRTDLDSKGSRYRGNAEACAQLGWPVPDSCSSAYPTFNY